MLQQMRRLSKSWISSIFLGGLALSFGVWGIADIFRGNTDTSIAPTRMCRWRRPSVPWLNS